MESTLRAKGSSLWVGQGSSGKKDQVLKRLWLGLFCRMQFERKERCSRAPGWGSWASPHERGREGRQGSWAGFFLEASSTVHVLKQMPVAGLEQTDTVWSEGLDLYSVLSPEPLSESLPGPWGTPSHSTRPRCTGLVPLTQPEISKKKLTVGRMKN